MTAPCDKTTLRRQFRARRRQLTGGAAAAWPLAGGVLARGQ